MLRLGARPVRVGGHTTDLINDVPPSVQFSVLRRKRMGSLAMHTPPALYARISSSPSLPFALSAALTRCPPPSRLLHGGRAFPVARAAAPVQALSASGTTEPSPSRSGRGWLCAPGVGFRCGAAAPSRTAWARHVTTAATSEAEARTDADDEQQQQEEEYGGRELAAERPELETAALASLGVTDFSSLGVDEVLVANLKRRGFTEPTYVQVTFTPTQGGEMAPLAAPLAALLTAPSVVDSSPSSASSGVPRALG